MPKMKTNRGAAKRFRRTANGGFKRGQSHRRHILTKKSSKRKRQLGTPALIIVGIMMMRQVRELDWDD